MMTCTKDILLVERAPMALEIDHRDLTNRVTTSWLFVTSHEIYHITETHYCACTRVGLPEGAANGA
jgi:hypothetical protein